MERYTPLLPNPVERLKFVLLCSRVGRQNDHRRPGFIRRWRSRAAALQSLRLTSARAAETLGSFDSLLLWLYRHRGRIRKYAGAAVVSMLAVPLAGSPARRISGPAEPRPLAGLAGHEPGRAPASPAKEVWAVETAATAELYSNGLRVLNDFPARTAPRSYPVSFIGPGADPYQVEWRRGPAGIVYHTTESEVAPLEPSNSSLIQRRGRGLLEYVQRNKLYNFVIDRFGRVYRVVPEDQYAHHAGLSVWTDGREVYLNLNQSFVGVAFEARTETETDVTAAQLHSAGLLTEMLRSRYGIADRNCVSHDLVSVNPSLMLIGYHIDWAGGFPYDALNLSNKYELPTPSVSEFGFGYDAAFERAVHGRIWPGIRLSEARIEREAARRGIPADRYRGQLREDYRRRAAPLWTAARARR